MRITSITDFTASKKKITLDEDITLVVYKGDILKFHLQEDTDFQEEDFLTLKEIVEKRAKIRCLKLLERKDYTYKQLQDKLHKDGYSNDIIQSAVSYVESYGYLSDTKYAIGYAEAKLNRKSRREVKMLLEQRGISSEEIREAFEVLEQEGRIMPEEEVAYHVLYKKKYTKDNSFEDKQKISMYLQQKGFSISSIKAAFQMFDNLT